MSTDLRLAPLASFQIPSLQDGREILSYFTSNSSRHSRSSSPPADMQGHGSTSHSSEHAFSAQNSPVGQFQFVQSNAPSGKVERYARTQVRSYVMRKYHQKRHLHQIHKNKLLRNNREDLCRGSQYDGHSFIVAGDESRCSRPTPTQAPVTFSTQSCNEHVRTTQLADLGRNPGLDSIATSQRPVICTRCGEMRIQSWTDDGSMILTDPFDRPHGPRDIGSFDPFASSAVPMTHSMQELLHHCESFVPSNQSSCQAQTANIVTTLFKSCPGMLQRAFRTYMAKRI